MTKQLDQEKYERLVEGGMHPSQALAEASFYPASTPPDYPDHHCPVCPICLLNECNRLQEAVNAAYICLGYPNEANVAEATRILSAVADVADGPEEC